MYAGVYALQGYMIDDLKKIKNSFREYQDLCTKEKNIKSDRWFSLLDKTEWLYHIQNALETANIVLNSLKVSMLLRLDGQASVSLLRNRQ